MFFNKLFINMGTSNVFFNRPILLSLSNKQFKIKKNADRALFEL